MIGVGAWNSEVEYKDFKVVSADGRTLFESDFSKGMEGWKTAGGEWKIVDGALRQSAIVDNARAIVAIRRGAITRSRSRRASSAGRKAS